MVRLAVIEDSELLRTGLRVALEAGGHMEVVGEFSLSEAAVSDVERLRPDVVLLGMRRPDLNRSAAICRLIRSASSVTRVLVLSPGAWEDEALTSILSGCVGARFDRRSRVRAGPRGPCGGRWRGPLREKGRRKGARPAWAK